jgi:hypothetical protein
MLATPPAEPKLLVSDIHSTSQLQLLQEDQMALLAFNSSELKAYPRWFVLCMHFYVYAVDKARSFIVNLKQ